MWPCLFAVLFLFIWPALAQTFPPLTGRVVDAAQVLTLEERGSLEGKLKAYEDQSTHQVVVATMASLDGLSIEDYANRLFRRWQLGRKNKNDGVLLLVAPNERQVRIEVGYGLEGTLTDALSGIVISTAITPRFRQGELASGIKDGTDSILSILSGDPDWKSRFANPQAESGATITTSDGQVRPFRGPLVDPSSSPFDSAPVTESGQGRPDPGFWSNLGPHVFVIGLLIYAFCIILFAAFAPKRWRLSSKSGSSGSSGSSSSSSSSSSFSGGGGSSGGGGASGRW